MRVIENEQKKKEFRKNKELKDRRWKKKIKYISYLFFMLSQNTTGNLC